MKNIDHLPRQALKHRSFAKTGSETSIIAKTGSGQTREKVITLGKTQPFLSYSPFLELLLLLLDNADDQQADRGHVRQRKVQAHQQTQADPGAAGVGAILRVPLLEQKNGRFLELSFVKNGFLPRQARDKHEKKRFKRVSHLAREARHLD